MITSVTNYKIHIHDRNYSSWEIYDTGNLNKFSTIEINPIECKLFSNDVFSFDNNTVKIVHSTIRSSSSMHGVLVINGNKTYGRNKNGKLLYKCIPDDMRLPTFLVPYEIKHVGFSKVFINLYVTFDFLNWEDIL